jgi:hypothetical protein
MRTSFVGGTLGLVIAASGFAAEPVRISDTTRVSVNGIGTIRIGMSVGQARSASALELVPEAPSPRERDCYYVQPRSGLRNIRFMVADGKISRIDISNPNIRTLSGARIGMTETEIRRLYPGDVAVTPHKYDPAGHYLTLYPRSPRQVVFETDGRTVTNYRVGKVPEVGYVEGCS